MAAHLQKRYPKRLNVTSGDSTKTLPEFHVSHADMKCDVIIVDGGHSEAVATADMENFKPMASNDHILVIDDCPAIGEFVPLRKAYEHLKNRGLIVDKFQCTKGWRGVTVGRYNLNPDMAK